MSPVWYNAPIAPPSSSHSQAALARQAQLTKPAGSLGLLESLAVTLASHQHSEQPQLGRCHITLFAGDHGIAQHPVSAFPQSVTQEMIRNFASGGAAISVLARDNQTTLNIINLGTVSPMEALPGVLQLQLAPGSEDLSQRAAMSDSICQQALLAGAKSVHDIAPGDVFIAGEMGIGNTSSAAALSSALLNLELSQTVGTGTGIDPQHRQLKQSLIQAGLDRCDALSTHSPLSPLQYLAQLGGLEIAAMSGSFIAAAQRGVSILLDGYICSAAALVACQINPGVRPWILASHRSQEPGHSKILNHLNLQPLLDLQLRLGEGSGAALCIPLLRQACSLHNNMATFAQASVSQ